jgi:hypothetical protein
MIKKFKKITVVPGTFILFLTLMMMSGGVRADSVVTITLQGIVDTICVSTFQTSPNGQDLDLTLDATGQVVADGTLFCNSKDGFTVSLRTKNGAEATTPASTGIFLPITALAAENTLPYDLVFKTGSGGNEPVAFVDGVASNQIVGLPGGAINETFQLEISYLGDTSLAADTYTDQLTLSITAP